MIPVPWLEFADIELANANRTLTYLRRLDRPGLEVGLRSPVSGSFYDASNLECYCAEVEDGPFDDPANDSAAWYDSAAPASEEFLGLLVSNVEFGSVVTRPVNQRQRGAGLGRAKYGHRVVGVSGHLFATTARGMAYGERWLATTLAGARDDCAEDELRVLPACDPVGFRTLRHAGIVDGPVYSSPNTLPGCIIQAVSFQLASGNPFLLSDPQFCLQDTIDSGDETETCQFDTGPVAGSLLEVLITNQGATDLEGLAVFFEPCSGYTNTYSDSYGPVGGGVAEYRVEAIPVGEELLIDAVDRVVIRRERTTGTYTGSLDTLQLGQPGDPRFRWSEARAGVCQRVLISGVGASLGSAAVTATVYDREL